MTASLILKGPNGKWKEFPKSAPKDGTSIIIGGLTKDDNQWVDVIARFDKFSSGWQKICQKSTDSKCKWIVCGYVTLNNYQEIQWMYWHPTPESPFVSV